MTKLPEAEIFDVDGTLCDVRSIRHILKPPSRNFHEFHTASAFCPPNPEVVERVHEARARGRKVLVVTARMARYRILTRKWLQSCEIPFDGIWTRADGDLRSDVIVKREILAQIRLDYNPVKAHDDKPDVIEEVWRNAGIECIVVPGWDEQFHSPIRPGDELPPPEGS